jgi:flagellar biosynthesis chaperone FliJ
MMKEFFRYYLGIYNLERKIDFLGSEIDHMEHTTKLLRDQVEITLQSLARVMVKLEPELLRDDLDPKKREESDKLGERIIKRLYAENSARHHQFGDE